MTSHEREQLRLSLLRFLEAGPGRFGVPSTLLLQMARSEGRPDLDLVRVEQELEYLLERGLVTQLAKTISPENRAWKIAADGRDFLATH